MKRQIRVNNDEMRSLRKNNLSIIKIGHMLVCCKASRGERGDYGRMLTGATLLYNHHRTICKKRKGKVSN